MPNEQAPVKAFDLRRARGDEQITIRCSHGSGDYERRTALAWAMKFASEWPDKRSGQYNGVHYQYNNLEAHVWWTRTRAIVVVLREVDL